VLSLHVGSFGQVSLALELLQAQWLLELLTQELVVEQVQVVAAVEQPSQPMI